MEQTFGAGHIVFADSRGNITEADKAFLNLVGYSRGDLPLRWDELTPPKWHATDRSKFRELSHTGRAGPWEKECIARDGTRIPILIGMTLLPGSGGDCVALVLDLREIKNAEAAVKRAEERYEALYRSVQLVYFTLDRDHIVASVNTYGKRKLAYEKNELLGRSIFSLMHEDDREAAEKHLRVLDDGDSIAQWEFRLIKKNGSVVWASACAVFSPLNDDEREILLICKDVTKRKLAEQRVLEHQQQLRTLTFETFVAEERERRRIAVGLHDEIGHSLAMAKVQLDTLEDSLASNEMGCDIEAIRGLIDRTIRKTRSLSFELSSPVLYELGLERALKSLADSMGQKNGVRIRFETDNKARPISGDASVLLFRTVRELVHNIEKHAHAQNARIAIATLRDGVTICVEDDGVGMDVPLDRIKPKGFGLFSIREHLELIGGRMEIKSTPGEGTQIVVAVPLQKQ